MSSPPKTVLRASPKEEAAIRKAVRSANVAELGAGCVQAGPQHVAALVELLSDPAVSDPIYDLPRPICPETISAWVREADQARRRGEAILVVSLDTDGRADGYMLFTIWPDRASAEIAGAQRADRQNIGVGKRGAVRSFGWMFEALGVRLIGVTAALDNARSARVIEAAGFTAMGERESVRPDGTIRRSRYWEVTREAWRAHDGAAQKDETDRGA
jgi:RimJ/RimL family protein N-acetyltransferase